MKNLGVALFITILAFNFFTTSAYAQEKTKDLQIKSPAAIPKESINWLSWDEAVELSKKEKRKIFLDVYTDWCGWCKRMDKGTFQQAHIAKYINENFYPVKFDAEQKKELKYKDKVYKYINNGKRGYHELAAELLNGRMSFPTVVFLNEDFELIQSIMGYKTPQQFEQIATYFGTDYFKKIPWSSYQKNYKSILISD